MRLTPTNLIIASLLSAIAYPKTAFAQAAAGHGRQVYGQCSACHTGNGSMGPDLTGVVGRKAGALASYRYSPAMRGAGFVWTEAKLRAFLRDPSTVVPANKMPFGGLQSDRDADDVIAFLAGRH